MPADAEDLAFLMRALPEEIPVTVFGLGSNLLVRDGGVEGVVVRLSARGFGKVEVDGARLRVGAALADKRVAAHALEAGIGGFAFYHGIPGGIGGALRMNAGANGAETCERVVEVVAIDRRGERHVLSNADMGYSYRHAAVAGRPHLRRGGLRGRRRGSRNDPRGDERRAGAPRTGAAGEEPHRRLDLQEPRPARHAQPAQRLAPHRRRRLPRPQNRRRAGLRDALQFPHQHRGRDAGTTWSCSARRCGRGCWRIPACGWNGRSSGWGGSGRPGWWSRSSGESEVS